MDNRMDDLSAVTPSYEVVPGIHLEEPKTMVESTQAEPLLVPESRQMQPKVVQGVYRRADLKVWDAAARCAGIDIFGKTIRSLVVSTDVAVICNCDADAVLAVYPFTCQPTITQSIMAAAQRPVLTGVSGSVTTGNRSVSLAMFSELQGAAGVVLNAATPRDVIMAVKNSIDIPTVVTITEFSQTALDRALLADIVNVAAGHQTPEVVARLRELEPDLPIMASSGPTEETARMTVEAGADAISWLPPDMQKLERMNMEKNRLIAQATE